MEQNNIVANNDIETDTLMNEIMDEINAKIKEIKTLVSFLSDERASNYGLWMQIGQCLCNISNEYFLSYVKKGILYSTWTYIQQSIFDIWLEFSKKHSTKFNEKMCYKKWGTFSNPAMGSMVLNPNNYTMATLHHFSYIDNNYAYTKHRQAYFDKLVVMTHNKSHYSFAKLFYEVNRNQFVCTNITKNIWYEFRNHRWHKITRAYSIKNRISDDMADYYYYKYCELTNRIDKTDNIFYELKEDMLKNANKYLAAMDILNDTFFKDAIVKELANLAYDPDFYSKLNENTHLICFENGIYDLKNKYFRDGSPEDYISLCTNYDYAPYHKSTPIIHRINDYFTGLGFDADEKDTIFNLLSQCLSGNYNEENLYVLAGPSASGKTSLMRFIKYTFGDYFDYANNEILTKNKMDTLKNKQGIRMCLLEQCDLRSKLNLAYLKNFNSRKRGIKQFRPQFKSFIINNKLPICLNTPELLHTINFKKRFNVHERQDMEDKFMEWKQVFMSMLINHSISKI